MDDLLFVPMWLAAIMLAVFLFDVLTQKPLPPENDDDKS
jgi:hypothetical protein